MKFQILLLFTTFPQFRVVFFLILLKRVNKSFEFRSRIEFCFDFWCQNSTQYMNLILTFLVTLRSSTRNSTTSEVFDQTCSWFLVIFATIALTSKKIGWRQERTSRKTFVLFLPLQVSIFNTRSETQRITLKNVKNVKQSNVTINQG